MKHQDLANQLHFWPEVTPARERRRAREQRTKKPTEGKGGRREKDNGNPNLWEIAIDDLERSGLIDDVSNLNDILFLFRTRDVAYQNAAGAPFQARKGQDFAELLAHACADAVAAYTGLAHSPEAPDISFRLLDIYEPLIEILVRIAEHRRAVRMANPPKVRRKRKGGETDGSGEDG